MRSSIAILLVVCLLSSALMSSASAAVIESTELSQSEAEDFAQAQVSAETINATTGGDEGWAWLAVGAVAVVAVCICWCN